MSVTYNMIKQLYIEFGLKRQTQYIKKSDTARFTDKIFMAGQALSGVTHS